MRDLTVAGLAQAGGVGVETIRFYQRRGLLRTPERSDNGGHAGAIRRYNSEDLHNLRFIRSAQAAGFKLDEIAELMVLDTTKDRGRVHQLAAGRVAALDKQIAELKAARDALASLAEDCASGSAGPCPILAAFESS